MFLHSNPSLYAMTSCDFSFERIESFEVVLSSDLESLFYAGLKESFWALNSSLKLDKVFESLLAHDWGVIS